MAPRTHGTVVAGGFIGPIRDIQGRLLLIPVVERVETDAINSALDPIPKMDTVIIDKEAGAPPASISDYRL